MLETSKKIEKPHQKCQSGNYKSTAPSGASSEAITVAIQVHRTTLLNFLNTGRYVLIEECGRIHTAIETLY